MFAQNYVRAGRESGRWRRQSQSIYLTAFAFVIVGLLAQGCSLAPRAPSSGPDPANPNAVVPSATYRSTVEPYSSVRPVAPAPWSGQDERVAPQPKS